MKLKNIIMSAAAGSMLLAVSCSQQNTPQSADYTQYVNTFIGAADNGHTFPGACLPFGMMQASPETGAIGWRYCSGYTYTDSLIWGFAQMHLNGTGCMDFGDILIQPVTGEKIRDDYRSPFRKETESARPGYYTVDTTMPTMLHCLSTFSTDWYGTRTSITAMSASVFLHGKTIQHSLAKYGQKYGHSSSCSSLWNSAVLRKML